MQARELLQHDLPADPLHTHVAELARKVLPPARFDTPFVTDMRAKLSPLPPDLSADAPPDAAGLVDRSDVTLFAVENAAGVFVVRSRRNWKLGGETAAEEEEYYRVRRSLADFAWLEERLRCRYEAVIVPPLPDMAVAGRVRFGYAYEGERMRGLQRFLRRVATHVVLSTGDEVLAFLGASGEEAWRKIRREPIAPDGSITTALFGTGHEAGAMERLGSWGGKLLWQAGRRVNKGLVWFLERDSGSEVRRREDNAEARLERLQDYVQELGMSLSKTRLAVKRVATSRDSALRDVAALQGALHALGEREGGAFGGMLQQVVLAVDAEDTMRVMDAEEGDAMRVVDETFLDYEERARGAQRIMRARKEEQEAYEHAVSVYTRLRDRLESRTGSMWDAGERVEAAGVVGREALVDEVNAASMRLAEVRRRYQMVATSTTEELRRLRMELHQDVCDALSGLAGELAGTHAGHSRKWTMFAAALEEFREGGGRGG